MSAAGASSSVIEAWHDVVRNMSVEALDPLLAEDAVFHSPVVHSPQQGKALVSLYLTAAFGVFSAPDGAAPGDAGSAAPGSGKFRYVRELVGERDAVLEFVTEIDGIVINGVDMIQWNEAGQITDFKVMVRPLKAIQKLHALMAAMLERSRSA